jgi:D-glycero-D-manno-heptose 1,7-bisphosphate phosphatase
MKFADGIIQRMFPGIFLDRDGVIIENRPDYVRTRDDVSIYPQALDALVSIRESPHKIVIVTNQSAIGRGLMSHEAAQAINSYLISIIEAAGGRIDGIFMCPHAPDQECYCRKPNPGLILEAAQSLSIDLQRSLMVGDALSDILAGHSAGIPQLILVRTGRGIDQLNLPQASELPPFLTFDTLSDALGRLI